MHRPSGAPRRPHDKRSKPSATTTTARGHFAAGIWHCDCTPRLPAEHFRVKKVGKNHGRWFYTCQLSDPDRCGFFLWDDEAKPREEAAVLSGRRTEPVQREKKTTEPSGVVDRGRGVFAGWEGRREMQGDESSTDSPTPSPTRTGSLRRGKRDARGAKLDEDVSNDGKSRDRPALETPRKAPKVGVYASPATTGKRKLPWLEQSETTPVARSHEPEHLSTTPSRPPTTRTALNRPTTPLPPPDPLTVRTPSPPARHRNALLHPDDGNSTLAHEVMSLLATHSCPLPEPLHSQLRSVLTKHDLKTQGVLKGRDISRVALKAKDARIAELQGRIAQLEAEREVDLGVIRALRRNAARA